MTNGDTLITKALRHPFSFALLVLSAVILLVWIDQRDSGVVTQPGLTDPAGSNQAATTPMPAAPVPATGPQGLLPPNAARAGGEQPKIMQRLGAAKPGGVVQVPGLAGLLKGLEDKVKADPGNLNNHLLLAQTYHELGMPDKAMASLRELKKDHPDHPRLNLILASLLSRSDKAGELKESLEILKKLSGESSVTQYLVNLYQGDALMRSNDNKGAIMHWKAALSEIPENDSRYRQIERQIADLSGK